MPTFFGIQTGEHDEKNDRTGCFVGDPGFCGSAARNQALNPELANTVKELSLILNKGKGWRTVKQALENNM
jgi:hypothetical protein